MKFDKSKAAVWCYSEWKIEEVNKSIKDFKMGVNCCDGSEKNRYANILVDLLDIKEKSIDELKDQGFRFHKVDDTYYPVASDQDEDLMKENDVECFNVQQRI